MNPPLAIKSTIRSAIHPESQAAMAAPRVLAEAYARCEAITAEHSRSFYLASALMSRAERRAVRALYAFCRVSDNLVDNGGCSRPGAAQARAALREWRRAALSAHPPEDEPVALAWADARRNYGVPLRYAEQLLEGVARDLRQCRYDSFAELAVYCYGVASTVGLMSMHIVGFSGQRAAGYAVQLGIALQLTNILRDVGEDWRAGRVYLPQRELAAYGLSDADLALGTVTARWRAFMRFQVERNRRLYAQAWPGLRLLHAGGRPAVTAAAVLYRAILDDIEAHDYDVFARRAHAGAGMKLKCLLQAVMA